MGQVPNTSTFTLQDVCVAIYGSSSSGKNLSQCFTDATGTFDSNYVGSKNSLYNFRNYQHVVQKPTLLIYCSATPQSVSIFRLHLYAVSASDGISTPVASSITCYVNVYQNSDLLYGNLELVLSIGNTSYDQDMSFDVYLGSNLTTQITMLSIVSDSTYNYAIG